jgi:DegV family protein with EDD domain
MLTFFTDTDCDFTPEEAKKYGCKLISMPFSIDGKTFYPYEDSETFDMKPFYEKLREGVIPTTGGVTEKKYDDYFRPEFEAGNDILYVHFSAAMTATFDSMKPAVDALLKEFPERKFYEIDTKGITIISYNILCEIGDMLLAGKSAEEIVEWANVEVDKFSQYFFADDLKFFKRSGRVSGISATMGTLLGIRPIIYMTPDGRMESIGKERGRDKAMQRLVQYVDELGDNIADHRIIIGHTDAPEIADGLAAMLRERFGDNLNIKIVCTNPTAGSHCGPNGAGISFHSKHR